MASEIYESQGVVQQLPKCGCDTRFSSCTKIVKLFFIAYTSKALFRGSKAMFFEKNVASSAGATLEVF